MKNKISIVIIGRNEEQSIRKCLTAASTAAEQIGGAEIIFVDSASTDKTVFYQSILRVSALYFTEWTRGGNLKGERLTEPAIYSIVVGYAEKLEKQGIAP